MTPRGADWGPPIFFPPLFFCFVFCDWKPHNKFQNPTITPSGRKVTQAERREREKTPLILDT